MVLQGSEPLAKSPVMGAVGIEELPDTNVSLSEGIRTSKGVLPPRPHKHSLAVAHRKCKTHVGQPRSLLDRRPWDAWERRSLKRQLRDTVGERSSGYTAYSRGPELLKAMEMLKSRSHS